MEECRREIIQIETLLCHLGASVGGDREYREDDLKYSALKGIYTSAVRIGFNYMVVLY